MWSMLVLVVDVSMRVGARLCTHMFLRVFVVWLAVGD